MTTDSSDIAASEYKARPSFLKTKIHFLIFFILLGIGAYWRFWGFFLPSNVGDSPTYQGLAMKMNYGYLKDYTIFRYRIAPRPDNSGIVDYLYEPDPNRWNSRRIRDIYHRPLHLQPPLLSTLIWFSHGIFKHGHPYASVGRNLGEASIRANPPWHYFHAQYYAILIPYLCSLSTLILVYWFCLKYYSAWEGLLAVLVLIASPIDIAVGAKMFADGPLTLFCFAALILFLTSLDSASRKPYLRAGLAGFLLGMSFLTKSTCVLFAFGMLVASLLKPKEGIFLLWKRHVGLLLWSGIVTFLVTLPWNLLMTHHYGSPFVNTPPDPGNPWYAYVFGRPLKAYFFDMIFFLPPLAVGWGYGLVALTRPFRHWRETALFLQAIFYLGMFMFFARSGTAGVEDRYLMPIYPLVAILMAHGLVKAARLLRAHWAFLSAYACVFATCAYFAWRAAPIGLSHSFRGLAVFKPLGY